MRQCDKIIKLIEIFSQGEMDDKVDVYTMNETGKRQTVIKMSAGEIRWPKRKPKEEKVIYQRTSLMHC